EDGVEKLQLAEPLVGAVSALRLRWGSADDLGQGRSAGEDIAVLGPQLLEHLGEGEVGEAGVGNADTVAEENGGAIGCGQTGELGQQAALADTGVAGDEDGARR